MAPVRATDEVILLRTAAKTIRGSPSLTRHPDNLLLTSFARSGSQGSSSSQCRDCLSISPAHHASACLYPPQVATGSARFGRIRSAAHCCKCQGQHKPFSKSLRPWRRYRRQAGDEVAPGHTASSIIAGYSSLLLCHPDNIGLEGSVLLHVALSVKRKDFAPVSATYFSKGKSMPLYRHKIPLLELQS